MEATYKMLAINPLEKHQPHFRAVNIRLGNNTTKVTRAEF